MVSAFRLRAGRLVIIGLSLGLSGSVSFGAAFFVSPTGRASGDGTMSDPWDLQTALNHPSAVEPGDTIWLRNGTYMGRYESYLTGTSDAPIVLRQYPGERATIDGADSGGSILLVKGDYAWYWGFEIMSSHPARVSQYTGQSPPDILRGVGVGFNQYNGAIVRGNKLINLVVHDTLEGYFFNKSARDSEIYGSIVYYNGWVAPGRLSGHGIYPRNSFRSKRVVDNIVFFQFGHGIHAWSDEPGSLNNLDIEGNVVFDNGAFSETRYPNILVGGAGDCVAYKPQVTRNFTYCSGPNCMRSNDLGYVAGTLGLQAKSNYLAAECPTVLKFTGSSATMLGNEFVGSVEGFGETEFPWNVYRGDTRPAGVRIFVRPNQYEPGRAHIAIYNWDRRDDVEADLSGVLAGGTAYEIRDVQNYFGPPVISGIYAGGTVTLPMDLSEVARPVGNDLSGKPLEPPGHTPREFGAFVLLPCAADDDVDGVPQPLDVCSATPAPGGVDEQGRSLGDLDRDCDVDLDDLGVFVICYGGSGELPAVPCPPEADADFDDDGDVDLDDLAVFAANYTGRL